MKKTWLVIFNAVTLLAWALFLSHALLHGLVLDKQGLFLLTVAQGLAVFEIMNAMIGIVGAHWLLTAIQVIARFLIVLLLYWIPGDALGEWSFPSSFALIAIAWSITELTRALYYLINVLGYEVDAVTFSRYTFFIFLYPLGVSGEFMLMYAIWEWRQFDLDIINSALAAFALAYFLFFPMLYRHMLKQRRKKLSTPPLVRG